MKLEMVLSADSQSIEFIEKDSGFFLTSVYIGTLFGPAGAEIHAKDILDMLKPGNEKETKGYSREDITFMIDYFRDIRNI